MISKRSKLRLVTLMGTTLPGDKDLTKRLKKYKKDASFSEVFNEISKWEKDSLKEFRDRERTSRSGKLHSTIIG